MARNGSGIFAVLNPILVGALRSSSAVNGDFSDAGNEITNSLPRSGIAAMTGQFKAVFGQQTAPGISWDLERGTGFRIRDLNSMAWVSGGVDRFYDDGTGQMHQVGNMDIAGASSIQGGISGSGSDMPQLEAIGSNGIAYRTGVNIWVPDDGTQELGFQKENGNNTALPTGVLVDFRVHFACTITEASMMLNAAGACTVDILKSASYPPASSIVAAAPPQTSGAATYENQNVAGSGWTTSIAAGDMLRFSLTSNGGGIKRIAMCLKVKRFN